MVSTRVEVRVESTNTMSVTQKQIAEEVGLSRSMVALALSGHPKISEQTRLKVEAVAQRLGYTEHSNSSARALIARRYGQQVKTGTLAGVTAR
jgi:LacI family transcriptional regulator